MTKNGYDVRIKEAHIKWGTYRNTTNRTFIDGESYVKIPSDAARRFAIIRGKKYTAYFTNGMKPINIKASGNGPFEDGIQYAKQFEGVGKGACKAFTPWYASYNAKAGDIVHVEFLSPTELEFSIK